MTWNQTWTPWVISPKHLELHKRLPCLIVIRESIRDLWQTRHLKICWTALNTIEIHYTKHKPMQKMGFSHLKHEGLACQCTSTVSPSLSEGAKVGDTMPLDIASDNRFSSGDMYSPQASQTCNTNDQLPIFLETIMTRFRKILTRKKCKNVISAKRKIFQFFQQKIIPGRVAEW